MVKKNKPTDEVYVCVFCSKLLRDEEHKKNHTCKFKKRWEEYEEEDYQCWADFCEVYNLKKFKRNKITKKKEIIEFVEGPRYHAFHKLNKWMKEKGVLSTREFFKYCRTTKKTIYEWKSDEVLKYFICWFIDYESDAGWMNRCTRNIQEGGYKLEELTQWKLFCKMETGELSKKYLRHVKFDYLSRLTEKQIESLGRLAVDEKTHT